MSDSEPSSWRIQQALRATLSDDGYWASPKRVSATRRWLPPLLPSLDPPALPAGVGRWWSPAARSDPGSSTPVRWTHQPSRRSLAAECRKMCTPAGGKPRLLKYDCKVARRWPTEALHRPWRATWGGSGDSSSNSCQRPAVRLSGPRAPVEAVPASRLAALAVLEVEGDARILGYVTDCEAEHLLAARPSTQGQDDGAVADALRSVGDDCQESAHLVWPQSSRSDISVLGPLQLIAGVGGQHAHPDQEPEEGTHTGHAGAMVMGEGSRPDTQDREPTRTPAGEYLVRRDLHPAKEVLYACRSSPARCAWNPIYAPSPQKATRERSQPTRSSARKATAWAWAWRTQWYGG